MGPLGLVSILGPAYFAGLLFVCVGVRRRAPAPPTLRGAAPCVRRRARRLPVRHPVRGRARGRAHEQLGARGVRPLRLRPRQGAERVRRGVLLARGVLALRPRGRLRGQGPVIFLLRWFPLAIELAYLAPMLAIARASGVSRRAGWLGVALFFGTDWIYQDYFSPQAVNFLFYLSVVAVVLTCWRPSPRSWRGAAQPACAMDGDEADAPGGGSSGTTRRRTGPASLVVGTLLVVSRSCSSPRR